jgi:hypothetical protein
VQVLLLDVPGLSLERVIACEVVSKAGFHVGSSETYEARHQLACLLSQQP